MKKVIKFSLKSLIKNKYLLFVPLFMTLIVISVFGMNLLQPSSTHKNLQELIDNREKSLNTLISQTLRKENAIGLPIEGQQALDSLLLQENYLKEISSKLKSGDLNISSESIKYIEEYDIYKVYPFILYNNENLLEIERQKVERLAKYKLPYLEQEKPTHTALFTKQLFQLFFNPLTAFIFFLLFWYKINSDRRNGILDFFKVNSLFTTSIHYGYLYSFFLITLGYILFASLISFLPIFLTGNVETIHYPIEIEILSKVEMVPVWKWLIFLPIGWGIFVAFLLVIAIILFKFRYPLGVSLSAIAGLSIIGYIITINFGLLLFNPIHLIFSYETDLLTSHRYITYLLVMFTIVIICLISLYPFFHSKKHFLKPRSVNSIEKQYEPKNKWKLIQFEHLKNKRKGNLLFTFIFLCGIIVGTFIFVNQQFQSLPKKSLKVIESLQNINLEFQQDWEMMGDEFEIESEIVRSRQENKDNEMMEAEENPYIFTIEVLADEYQMLEDLKREIGSNDFFEKFHDMMGEIDSNEALNRSDWNLQLLASEEQQRILKERNITPWPLGSLWVTNFNEPNYAAIDNEHYNLLKAVQERHEKYENSTLFFLYKFLDWNIMWFIMGGFVLLVWTSLSEEYRPNLTKVFLSTKPITQKSIFSSKWAYNLIVTFSSLFLCGGIAIILSIIIGGFGETQYPILVYAVDQYQEDFLYSNMEGVYYYFEDLFVLILKSGLLIVAQLFFLNSLFSFIGRWLTSQYATILVTLLISFLGFLIGQQYIEFNSMYLNPFLYFDTWNVIDGWKSILANSPKVHFLNGFIILITSGVLLFAAGLFTKRRRGL